MRALVVALALLAGCKDCPCLRWTTCHSAEWVQFIPVGDIQVPIIHQGYDYKCCANYARCSR